MLKAIIFDFDGVIGDTFEINYYLSKLNNPNLSIKEFKDHHNGNVMEKPKFKIPNNFFELQKKKFTKDNLFKLKEILIKLNKKYKLFIISSTIDENVKFFLELDKYDILFEKVLGSTTHKSKVEKFKMIFNEFNLKSNECLFVTDTIGDIIESRKVDVKCIGVSWGYHDIDFLLKEKPLCVIDSSDELFEVIEKFEK